MNPVDICGLEVYGLSRLHPWHCLDEGYQLHQRSRHEFDRTRIFDLFSPPAYCPDCFPDSDPLALDTGALLSKIDAALGNRDCQSLAQSTLCSEFLPRYNEAKSRGELLICEGQRIAVYAGYHYGLEVLLYSLADVTAKTIGIPAGYITSGILEGTIVSRRTGRASVDGLPYWEINSLC